MTGAVPVMQAANNLNLLTGGQVTNAGLLSSIAGNISIATIAPTDLIINNAGGQIQALAGSINVRDPLFTAATNTVIWQGSLSAGEVNIFGGTGTTQVNVHDISGLVNLSTNTGNLNVLTGDLAVGNIQVADDDTVITNTGGNILLYNNVINQLHSIIIGAGGWTAL